MFKYSSTHILNNLDGVKAYTKAGEEASSVASTNYLLVDTDAKFTASAITKIDKATAVDAQVEKISFTMPAFSANNANGRLYIYVRTVDKADPLYANDWIYKGKPFQIEFKGSTTASTAASNLVANANKWLNFIYGKKVLKISNSGATVTIEVADGNVDLRFFKVDVQEFTEATSANDYKYNFYADGAFASIGKWVKSDPAGENTLTVTYVQHGNSGFGTYNYLLKNLRLPTNANMNWLSINSLAGELPVVGKKYAQYIITQCTERPEMQGTSVLGQYNKSVTTHILWVESTLVSNFETELAKVYTSGQATTVTGHANTETNVFDAAAAAPSVGD